MQSCEVPCLSLTCLPGFRCFPASSYGKQGFLALKQVPEVIELVAQLRVRYRLKIAVVRNEARKLNEYRVRKFKLGGLVDSFISSCFVHIRKPDADIFRLALDIAQVPARQVVYIENAPMFVEVSQSLSIQGIHH